MCTNCGEGNIQDAIFCSKCKMVMSFEGDQELLEEQKNKDDELQSEKERMVSIENLLVAIQPMLQHVKPEILSNLQVAGKTDNNL